MLAGAIENRILSEVKELVWAHFQDPVVDPVHDFDSHISVVPRNVAEICIGEKQDPFVPVLAAWLHDVGRIAEIKARREGLQLAHAQASAEQVPVLLAPFKNYLGNPTIIEIQDAVAKHSEFREKPSGFFTLDALQDGDNLAGLGAVGFYRIIAELASEGHHLINPDNPFPNGRIKPNRFKEADASCIEGVLYTSEWYKTLKTKTAKTLSKPHAGITARLLWQIAYETNTQRECAKNRLIREVLSVHAPDIHATIKSFFVG